MRLWQIRLKLKNYQVFLTLNILVKYIELQDKSKVSEIGEE